MQETCHTQTYPNTTQHLHIELYTVILPSSSYKHMPSRTVLLNLATCYTPQHTGSGLVRNSNAKNATTTKVSRNTKHNATHSAPSYLSSTRNQTAPRPRRKPPHPRTHPQSCTPHTPEINQLTQLALRHSTTQ